ncbi:hypothetical protein EDM56_08610 [Brevibacillus fluminis]|uniref:Type 4 fimbrial biogenesis protein PilX N-terminal domain-containing protein n=1 Tax=Brevibacillus fluminis TaxID=511487 RepID=A0A3M8DQZ8_9BACL|nr:hypothetical protein [Brevibacillus fluminis]RNB90556.1 hypothetical protein EDM56_08610 [Brevibacillus fluminis]
MKLKEENGYAAIVALIVIVLLTVIGTNLLQVTLSSLVQARKTESRSEAEYNARMGMEEALARINKAVTQGNAEIQRKTAMLTGDSNTLDVDGVQAAYDRAFSSLEANSFTPMDESPYKITIKREPTKAETAKKKIEAFVAKLVVESVGEAPSANGHVDRSTLKATIYVTSLPEEFYYVLSTPDDPASVLTLNGAAYIEGDVFSHAYSLSKTATYYLETNDEVANMVPKHKESTYPSIIGVAEVPFVPYKDLPSRFQKDGNAFDDNGFSSVKKAVQSQWDQALVLAPTLKFQANPHFGNIQPIDEVVKRKGAPIDFKKPGASVAIEPLTYQGEDQSGVVSKSEVNQSVIIGEKHHLTSPETFQINGNLTMQENADLQVIDGNLLVGGTGDATDSTAAATLRGSVSLVDSTGTRNSNAFIYVNGNAVLEDLTFDGNIYVNGDLYVQKNFQMNGTVYVSKNVYFTEDGATKEAPNTGKTLVILAKGTVEAYNLNLYDYQSATPKPKEMHVFIVSQDPAGVTLYGVGSNVRFVGGIHANKIELNAVRGKVNEPNKDAGETEPEFVDPKNNDPKSSRLSTIYADDIFENTPPGIPIIHRLSYHIQSMAFETN